MNDMSKSITKKIKFIKKQQMYVLEVKSSTSEIKKKVDVKTFRPEWSNLNVEFMTLGDKDFEII